MKKIFLMLALVFIAGCVQAKDFNYGVKQVNAVDSKYNTTMETYPKSINKIGFMLNDLNELKKIQLQTGQEAFNYVVDYQMLNLEAEKFYMQSQKYGDAGTTKKGFGCKIRPLILESASLRSNSAMKGFQAVNLLMEFVNKYPKDANSIGLSNKNALFLNATFYKISEEARIDSNIINHFCPKNESLESYQRQFRKETNLSEDFIKNLTYEQAVPIWKRLEELD